jgi:transporter family-2 protein
MILIFALLAIAIGALMPVQAGLNAELTRHLKHPYLGALLSLVTGSIIVGGLALTHGDFGNLKALRSAPPHLLLGGAFGAVFVGSAIYFIPRMGATAMITSFITGQLICSLIIDHYGLFGLPRAPVTMVRIFGIFLLFAGLLLVIKKPV